MALIEEANTLVMTPGERSRATVLVVESDPNDRNNMRVALRNLGFGGIADAPNHAQALERFGDRKVTHVIFDAKKTNMPPKEFLSRVFEIDNSIIAIPTSFEPNVDDVFDLLVQGAKGYLCKPFTIDTVDLAIISATKGEPMSEVVLQAKDRNEALVAIVMSSLDRAATTLRQAQKFETAKRDLPRCLSALQRSADLAKTFSKNGDQGMIEALEKFCIERSKGPATRLGRLRKKLKTTRTVDPVPNQNPTGS